MSRVLLLTGLLILTGCQGTPERQALRLLPKDAGPLTYAELMHRAMLQYRVANEAYCKDGWNEVEEAALALEQTAQFLPRSPGLPAERKAEVTREADGLAREAVQLAEAARGKKAQQVHEHLQRFLPRLRALHALTPPPVEEKPLPPPASPR